MTNTFINMAMGQLEDMTNMMKFHYDNGNHDLVMLLDKEARELANELDNGEFMTLPQI